MCFSPAVSYDSYTQTIFYCMTALKRPHLNLCHCTNTRRALSNVKYMNIYLIRRVCVRLIRRLRRREKLNLCKKQNKRKNGYGSRFLVKHKMSEDIRQMFGQNEILWMKVDHPLTIFSMDIRRKEKSHFAPTSNTVHSVLHKSTLFCPHFTTDRLHSLQSCSQTSRRPRKGRKPERTMHPS